MAWELARRDAAATCRSDGSDRVPAVPRESLEGETGEDAEKVAEEVEGILRGMRIDETGLLALEAL